MSIFSKLFGHKADTGNASAISAAPPEPSSKSSEPAVASEPVHQDSSPPASEPVASTPPAVEETPDTVAEKPTDAPSSGSNDLPSPPPEPTFPSPPPPDVEPGEPVESPAENEAPVQTAPKSTDTAAETEDENTSIAL